MRTWLVVKDFYDDMISNGYASDDGSGCKRSKLGDIIQFFSNGKKDWTHSAILTKLDSTGMYYSAHSKNRYDWPTWQPIMSGNYTDNRVIKFW
ncbi:putative amidase domain protein [Clostridium vincentii]|uniref:Putative amidase domain protein n=2 Tax=Clostridium vincentii TaxID=52704 RepID=A0A2T0BHT2_9CLOT|nr:putative amidase domain protein [Clostridium vincentii]